MKVILDKVVRIKDKRSAFYNTKGRVLSKGNGDMWQVEVINGMGVYFDETQLEVLA